MKWLALLFLGLYATNALHVETENYEEYAEEHDQEENGLQDHDEEYGLQEHDEEAKETKQPKKSGGRTNKRRRRRFRHIPKGLLQACSTACTAAGGIRCNPKEAKCCKTDGCAARERIPENKYCKHENILKVTAQFKQKTRKC